jgi:thiosulfate/3-mercaptopyruvate sulfurtransferase
MTAAVLPGPLVEPDWLEGATGSPGLVIADVRWYLDGRSASEAFRAAHLPGAIRVDVDTELSGPTGPGTGRHPLPDRDAFVTAMAARGIGPSTAVVAYDDAGGSIAARLWWMLHVLGWPVAVLDGGLGAWTGAVETGPVGDLAPATPDPGPGAAPRSGVQGIGGAGWPAGTVAGTDEVAAGVGLLLDARTPARFVGAPGVPDPVPGHVPGAVNAPWTANLDPATGRFLPPEALASRYRSLGAGSDVVASCGSGVTACHDLLALHLAGLGGRLYPGSWSAWSSDPARPVASGPDRGGL